MKLFYSPGACSLAAHIALEELKVNYTAIRVDLKNHQTEDGSDYYQINASGSVPCLVMDDNNVLTQGGAILTYLAENFHRYKNDAPLTKARFHEWLYYLNSDVHKAFTPLYAVQRFISSQSGQEELKQSCQQMIKNHFQNIEKKLTHDYALGDDFSFVDPYLFVIYSWAKKLQLNEHVPHYTAHFERMKQRPAVQKALQQEGLNI